MYFVFFLPTYESILKITSKMNQKIYTHRIKYYETDKMQYVHHSNYAKFFESARVEWLRDAGISYKEMEDNNIMLPVVNLNIDFKKPALYDDLLTIKTSIKEAPKVKIIFEYEVYNQHQILLCKGTSTLVFVDMIKNKPIACPQPILEAINKQ